MAGGVELAGVGVELVPDPTSSTNITIGTSTITGGTTGRVLYDNAGVVGEKVVSGTGDAVLATSPTLITPTLGVATGTSFNGLTITSTTGVLTIAAGKTATVNNSITLAGTDATTMTFPGTSASIARTDAGQTFTGNQSIAGVLTAASATATPAGGSTAARLLFGTTAGFGIYYGSGAPSSLTAGQGSLYLRSDGTGVADRAYINTTGSTTWTAIATAG